MDLLTLGAAAALWCFLHSLFAADFVKNVVYKKIEAPTYRICYNIFSLLTLVPVVLCYLQTDPAYILRYPYPLKLLIDALFLMFLAASIVAFGYFDWRSFLGLKREERGLITRGIYRYSRHPMYASTIGLIWSRNLQERDLVINIVFSVYLIAAAFIEETRLIARYGDAYRSYMKRTSMFVPFVKH